MEGNTIETIEKLSQENEKLNLRLKKAIQVFNDQKATIARLENDRDNFLTRISELEDKLKTSEETDSQFFAQEETIDKLNSEKEVLQRALDSEIEDHYNNRDLWNAAEQKMVSEIDELKEKNKSLNGKLLAASKQIKSKDDYIESVTSNVNTFIDKMKICMGSLGEQVALINKDVIDNNIL